MVASHREADALLREQNKILRQLVVVQERNTMLATQDCEVMRAVDTACQETLEEVAGRLGIADQIDNLVRTSLWKRIREFKRGKGGGDETP